jgi:hypothetical protein
LRCTNPRNKNPGVAMHPKAGNPLATVSMMTAAGPMVQVLVISQLTVHVVPQFRVNLKVVGDKAHQLEEFIMIMLQLMNFAGTGAWLLQSTRKRDPRTQMTNTMEEKTQLFLYRGNPPTIHPKGHIAGSIGMKRNDTPRGDQDHGLHRYVAPSLWKLATIVNEVRRFERINDLPFTPASLTIIMNAWRLMKRLRTLVYRIKGSINMLTIRGMLSHHTVVLWSTSPLDSVLGNPRELVLIISNALFNEIFPRNISITGLIISDSLSMTRTIDLIHNNLKIPRIRCLVMSGIGKMLIPSFRTAMISIM